MLDGATFEIDQTPGDMVRFEREFGVPVSAIDSETMGVQHMMFLGYAGMKRKGYYHGTFDEFIDLVEALEGDTPKAAPAPAKKSPRTKTS